MSISMTAVPVEGLESHNQAAWAFTTTSSHEYFGLSTSPEAWIGDWLIVGDVIEIWSQTYFVVNGNSPARITTPQETCPLTTIALGYHLLIDQRDAL